MVLWRHCFGALLLTALTTAQLYDDAPPSDEYRLPYQPQNEIWRPEDQLQKSKEDGNPPIILFRLLTPPQEDGKPELFMRIGNNREQESDADEKFLLVPPKREVDFQGDFKTPSTKILLPRPQQKWKSKKGKKGSRFVCYFKLCAFRPPT